ncbi:hypothetical protein U8C35_07660 [Sinorhizobium medicae]|uniref:hypothetical protein n=1 Tax=Sinorhizobium medicae TaxID=110321 RepID=UPI002AF6C24A|nr:hypothetical protein [Sinorhizobium medicae]WQO60287.1 hypothetical protein U8C35_07660 [Sinorhizobium medicae]
MNALNFGNNKGVVMGWNFDIASAPRGKKVSKSITTNDGVKTFAAIEREEVILASKCGKVTLSYWIQDQERWCMFKKGEEPVAWMPWPEHPVNRPVKQHDVYLPILEDCGSGQ